MACFRVLLGAAALAVLLAASCGRAWGLESNPAVQAQSSYDEAMKEYQAAQDEAAQARSEYDRTKAERRLAAAEDGVRAARKGLAEQGLSVPDLKPGMQPADDAASKSDSKGSVSGLGGALDPRVFDHSWVGEPHAPTTPMRRPTVPDGYMEKIPADPSGRGPVGYGRVPDRGVPSIPKGASASHDPRAGAGRDAQGGPIEASPPALPAGGPVEREPQPPARGPVDDGLPARKGVDFVSEALPWRPGPWKALKAGKAGGAGDEELAALARSVQGSLRSGDAERALQDARRLRALAPADGGVRHLLAMVLNKLERFSEAEAEAREALRLGQAGAAVYETLAWAQLHLGRYEQAADSASQAIALSPDAALAYVIRAHAMERLGKRLASLADIAKAAALRPARFTSMARQAQAGGRLSQPSGGQAPPSRPAGEDSGRRPGGMAALMLALTAGGAGCLGALAFALRRRR